MWMRDITVHGNGRKWRVEYKKMESVYKRGKWRMKRQRIKVEK